MSNFVVNPYLFGSDCTYNSGSTFPDFNFTGDFEVSSAVIQANCDPGYGNNGSSAYLDLGASTVSNTEWILRFEFRIDSWQGTAVPGNNSTVSFGLYSGTESAGTTSAGDGTYSTPQEAVLIYVANAGGSAGGSTTYFQSLGTKGMDSYYAGAGAEPNPKRSNLLQTFSPAIYYMTIHRISADRIDFTYSGNSDYVSAPTATYSLTDTDYIPSDNSLRYLKTEAWQVDSTVTSSGINSSIYNIKFNNDTSEPCA